MGQTVLRVENLSKRYRLGAARGADQTFREMIHRTLGRLTSRRSTRSGREEFWALRDVSFSVAQGESVGIIGHNGAGKSTLLKILSSITDPTHGRALVRGQVASLLEVGTGFHPELSGRENIYLNGAILGMRRTEIKRKFDQIVAFAEVERFIDTPVKRYSSGMYVRLAFAVAAHLEPKILLVDEVLAVGDAAFQKKCLGKLDEVTSSGRTVLFVSHNMATIRALCTRGILLDEGRVVADGSATDAVDQYIKRVMSSAAVDVADRTDRQGDGTARITRVEVDDADGRGFISSSSRLKVTLSYKSDGPLKNARFLVGLYDYTNAGIYLLDSLATGELPPTLPEAGTLTCYTDPINLTPGQCFFNVALKKGEAMVDYVTNAVSFDVQADDAFGLKHTPSRSWVLCLLRQKWHQSGSAAA